MAGYCPAHADAGIATSGHRPHAPAASAVLRALTLAAILFLPVAALAGWFDKLTGTVEKAGSRVATGTLEKAALHVKALPAKTDGIALAAQATQEGHWRFVNKAGETFTAGTPDEMKRAVSVLHPEAKAGVRLSLYVTEDTIFSTAPRSRRCRPVPTCLSSMARRATASCAGSTAPPSASSPRCAPTSSWKWATGGCSRRRSGSWRARSTGRACACWRWSRAGLRPCPRGRASIRPASAR